MTIENKRQVRMNIDVTLVAVFRIDKQHLISPNFPVHALYQVV